MTSIVINDKLDIQSTFFRKLSLLFLFGKSSVYGVWRGPRLMFRPRCIHLQETGNLQQHWCHIAYANIKRNEMQKIDYNDAIDINPENDFSRRNTAERTDNSIWWHHLYFQYKTSIIIISNEKAMTLQYFNGNDHNSYTRGKRSKWNLFTRQFLQLTRGKIWSLGVSFVLIRIPASWRLLLHPS